MHYATSGGANIALYSFRDMDFNKYTFKSFIIFQPTVVSAQFVKNIVA